MPLNSIRLFSRIGATALLAVALAGCNAGNTAKTDTGSKTIPGITEKNLPIIDGSTSAIPVGDLIVARSLNLTYEFRKVADGTPGGIADFGRGLNDLGITFPVDTPTETMEKYRKTKMRNMFTGTNGAYLRLFIPLPTRVKREWMEYSYPEGKCDMVLVARRPSPDELKVAKEHKVEFDVRPIALDAFVFIVNAENPVKSLTIDQIRGVYTNKINNWKKLGGKDMPIVAFTRDRNSGSQELMDALVMKGLKNTGRSPYELGSMYPVLEKVADHPESMGYSVYYYEHIMHANSKNRLLGVNGIVPTRETIENLSYPLVAPVYLVTLKNLDKNSPTAKLRDWILSPDGQKMIEESGYVPLPQDKTELEDYLKKQ